MTPIDHIINQAKSALPYKLRSAPWSILKHGIGLLSTEIELNAYLSAYGEMHKVKCNAALQNFPYEKLPQRIQVIDWGCGQGLGTLCLLDNLYARGYIGRVKRITLIEPSRAALQRAEQNIKAATRYLDVQVETIQSYLPGDLLTPCGIASLTMNQPGTVHVFSNILDIPSVSLSQTAEIIGNGPGMQFVVCTSPVNKNMTRLDEFSKYFDGAELFSDICDSNYGYTSDTNHKYGCKTKSFFFNSRTISLNASVQEGVYTEEGAYDDYDMAAMVRSGYLSESLFKAYTSISKCLGKNDSIFLKPDLNGESPDIIVVRPGKGILVLDVFDEDLGNCLFEHGAFLVNGLPTASPLSRAFSYRDSIIEQHSSEILKKAVTDKSAWFIVRPAVWFSKGSRLGIESLFVNDLKPQGAPKRNIISGVVTLAESDLSSPDLWGLLDIKYNNPSFSDEACKQFLGLLKSQWHCFNEGDNEIHLTTRQSELARSYEGRVLRVKGVAGSGKTQILASTAVNCQLRTGSKILILTYNITLANYIKYRIGRVPADFPWNKFTITNYHNFFTSQAKNHDLKLNLASYDDPNFFTSVKDSLPKYSAILIDEAQDYKTEWFKILFNCFLDEKGEVVIFGDQKQDVYRRGSFEKIPNVLGHVWGPWHILKRGHRTSNQIITDLGQEFQLSFFGEVETTEEMPQLTFGGGVSYSLVPPNCPPEQLVQMVLNYVSGNAINLDQTVILSQTTDVLRWVEYTYRKRTGGNCMTTFETKEVFDSLLKSTEGKVNSHFHEELEKIRTNKKAHFTMVDGRLKMSTIYSYKGWEASCVILLLLPEPGHTDALENRPELIYTAITRAKDYLYVINLNNNTYHTFFQQHI